ncbi:hypothetical protein R1flu_009579 [Riccia fluitans]|uniref:Uncharacterized protein n=1 Tax=Riccia fluitans TaxID=41844 RepID=A0ABD1Z5I3_9MARC
MQEEITSSSSTTVFRPSQLIGKSSCAKSLDLPAAVFPKFPISSCNEIFFNQRRSTQALSYRRFNKAAALNKAHSSPMNSSKDGLWIERALEAQERESPFVEAVVDITSSRSTSGADWNWVTFGHSCFYKQFFNKRGLRHEDPVWQSKELNPKELRQRRVHRSQVFRISSDVRSGTQVQEMGVGRRLS